MSSRAKMNPNNYKNIKLMLIVLIALFLVLLYSSISVAEMDQIVQKPPTEAISFHISTKRIRLPSPFPPKNSTSSVGELENFIEAVTPSCNMDPLQYLKSYSPIQAEGFNPNRGIEPQINLVSGTISRDASVFPFYRIPEMDGQYVPGGVVVFKNAYLGPNDMVYSCKLFWRPGGCAVGKPFPNPASAKQWLPVNSKIDGENRLHGKVVVIKQVWGYSFYHLCIEDFTRISYVYEYLLKNEDVRILTYNNLPVTRKLFDLIGISPQRLISYNEGAMYSVETMLVPSETPCGRGNRPAISKMQTILREKLYKKYQHLHQPLLKLGKVNIVLQKRVSRALSNHDALLLRLRKEFPNANIMVHQPNSTFEETMWMFFHADLIISPHGAGISNIIVSSPNTSALIEIHPFRGNGVDLRGPNHINLCHMTTAVHCGVHYRAIVAESGTAVCSSYPVDIDKVIKHAKDLLQVLKINYTTG